MVLMFIFVELGYIPIFVFFGFVKFVLYILKYIFFSFIDLVGKNILLFDFKILK